MPPIARIIALVCLGMSPVCAAAQAYRPAEDPGSPPSRSVNAPWQDRTQAAPAGDTEAASRLRPLSPVQPALYESPVSPAGQTADARRAEAGPSAPAGSATQPAAGRQPDGLGGTRAASGEFHLPLPPPGNTPQKTDGPAAGNRSGLASGSAVVGSLAVVLGLFFVLAWAMRRTAPRGSMLLPTEVVEVLGRAPLASRQQVHLVRCGTKLLLVSVSPTGAETLTEITDPDEVTRLAGLCRQAHPDSVTATFRQVFQQMGREGSALGFLGIGRSSGTAMDLADRRDLPREDRDA
jgi:flagellar biogenesis protein FliO